MMRERTVRNSYSRTSKTDGIDSCTCVIIDYFSIMRSRTDEVHGSKVATCTGAKSPNSTLLDYNEDSSLLVKERKSQDKDELLQCV